MLKTGVRSIDLPKLSQELYRSARWLRVFTAHRTDVPEAPLLRFLRRPAAEVRAMVKAGEKVLGGEG